MSRMQMIVVAATVVDIVVCAAALRYRLRRRRGDETPVRFGLADAFVVIAAGSFAFVMKLPLLVIARVGAFGMLHLIYADLAIAAPALAVLTLMLTRAHRPRIRVSPAVILIAVLSLAAPFVAAYATFVEPYRLEERHTTVTFDGSRPVDGTNGASVANARPGGAAGESITIVVLADMQFAEVTDYERDVVRRAMAHKPDIVLLPGDVLQGGMPVFLREEAATRELLSGLSAPGGVFLVEGDVDSPAGLERLIEGTNIRFVYDRVVRANVRGVEIAIGGIQLEYLSPAALRTIDDLESATTADIRLLLAHRPDIALSLAPHSTIDLVVAGHTHGGQVQIPGFGPLITATRIPRDVAAGGLHRINGHRIYVSRGVGIERGQAPPLRLFCRPELSILHCDIN